MRIVIDARWYGVEHTGIGRYCMELIDNLQRIDNTNQYIILLQPKYYASWQPSAPNFTAALSRCPIYSHKEQWRLIAELNALKPDLVHFVSFNRPLLYVRPFVVTLHDLTLVHFKNIKGAGLKRWFYQIKYFAMRLILDSTVRFARKIIVPTNYSKAELIALFPNALPKILVTYEAVRTDFPTPANIDRFKLADKYLLYVGNYYPYKNVMRLIDAFANSTARKNNVQLVLCGKLDYFQGLIRARVTQLKLQDTVIYPGFVSDTELAGLYQSASVFVFPSLSEGFGLPGLEAMVQGTPVLSSRASCLPEVYGDAANYFDPLDTTDIATSIDALIADESRRVFLSRHGQEYIRRYSWETMAHETRAVYIAALSR